VLQCVAVYCAVLQKGAVWCSVLRKVVMCRSLLLCVAVCYNLLQCIAHSASLRLRACQGIMGVYCSVVRFAAVCCKGVQRGTVCCGVLLLFVCIFESCACIFECSWACIVVCV